MDIGCVVKLLCKVGKKKKKQANVNVLTVDTRLYSPPITKLPNLRTFSFILFPVKSRLFLLIPWRLPVNYYLNIIQLFTRYYIWCHCYKVILQVFIPLWWEGIWYQMIPCQWYQNLISVFYQKKKKNLISVRHVIKK